ncbi:hypothetical protein [Hyphococcus luteus]|uniref:Uncharacterized protein n=1 Tax=Hyphococcus luteus TaxID=2058213 RepID=A0A2S7K2M0_9PROT|nr:hypothetical protein [Marinicaulis flavus]PQA86749.1 hypothetical protein CW354_14765 [Marinicaulis flavus]
MLIEERVAFTVPGTGSIYKPETPHVFVCVTPPCEKNDVLAVPMGSFKGRGDESCVLMPGDHPRVVHKTIILYGYTRKFYVSAIEKLITSGDYAIENDVSMEVYERIVGGLFSSSFTPPWAYEYAKKQLGL